MVNVPRKPFSTAPKSPNSRGKGSLDSSNNPEGLSGFVNSSSSNDSGPYLLQSGFSNSALSTPPHRSSASLGASTTSSHLASSAVSPTTALAQSNASTSDTDATAHIVSQFEEELISILHGTAQDAQQQLKDKNLQNSTLLFQNSGLLAPHPPHHAHPPRSPKRQNNLDKYALIKNVLGSLLRDPQLQHIGKILKTLVIHTGFKLAGKLLKDLQVVLQQLTSYLPQLKETLHSEANDDEIAMLNICTLIKAYAVTDDDKIALIHSAYPLPESYFPYSLRQPRNRNLPYKIQFVTAYLVLGIPPLTVGRLIKRSKLVIPNITTEVLIDLGFRLDLNPQDHDATGSNELKQTFQFTQKDAREFLKGLEYDDITIENILTPKTPLQQQVLELLGSGKFIGEIWDERKSNIDLQTIFQLVASSYEYKCDEKVVKQCVDLLSDEKDRIFEQLTHAGFNRGTVCAVVYNLPKDSGSALKTTKFSAYDAINALKTIRSKVMPITRRKSLKASVTDIDAMITSMDNFAVQLENMFQFLLSIEIFHLHPDVIYAILNTISRDLDLVDQYKLLEKLLEAYGLENNEFESMCAQLLVGLHIDDRYISGEHFNKDSDITNPNLISLLKIKRKNILPKIYALRGLKVATRNFVTTIADQVLPIRDLETQKAQVTRDDKHQNLNANQDSQELSFDVLDLLDEDEDVNIAENSGANGSRKKVSATFDGSQIFIPINIARGNGPGIYLSLSMIEGQNEGFSDVEAATLISLNGVEINLTPTAGKNLLTFMINHMDEPDGRCAPNISEIKFKAIFIGHLADHFADHFTSENHETFLTGAVPHNSLILRSKAGHRISTTPTCILQEATRIPALVVAHKIGEQCLVTPDLGQENSLDNLYKRHVSVTPAHFKTAILTLEELHAKGMVFRDLKPENMFIKNGSVVFIDFDSSGLPEAFHSSSGTPFFTPEVLMIDFNNLEAQKKADKRAILLSMMLMSRSDLSEFIFKYIKVEYQSIIYKFIKNPVMHDLPQISDLFKDEVLNLDSLNFTLTNGTFSSSASVSNQSGPLHSSKKPHPPISPLDLSGGASFNNTTVSSIAISALPLAAVIPDKPPDKS